jgi:hypothetical protein
MTIPKSHRNADGVTRALSIRQPYVEQIMRGTKRIEYPNDAHEDYRPRPALRQLEAGSAQGV